jgi:hypothetical protein
MVRSVLAGCSFCILALVLTLGLGACGGGRTGSAATLPGGAKIAILVYADHGTPPGTAPEKIEQNDQLGQWMDSDLLAILDGTGYAASKVADPATPTGPGRYLLRTRIINYNAGSKAARMLVGMGAGAAKLDTAYELVGPNGSVYVAGAPSVGTGRDWKNAARKINLETVDAVNARLHQSL